MTGEEDLQLVVDAIRGGAADFLTKPFTMADFLQRFDAQRDQWQARWRLARARRALETMASIKADELSRTAQEYDEACDMAVSALGAALDLKDNETADHCTRVCRNCVRLGRELDLSEFELRNLKWGAFLHDVGKIGVPEHILLKAGPLLPEERRLMQRHPVMGCGMLKEISFLQFATDIVRSHHERFDGTGYPDAVGGLQIPLNARIFSVLDTLDAITSDRPYRPAQPFRAAAGEIERQAGSQFDPAVVAVFLGIPEREWMMQAGSPAA